MNIQNLRIRLFWALIGPFSAMMRRRRLALFQQRLGICADQTVLDLGGQPTTWAEVVPPLDITIVNLPGIVTPRNDLHHRIVYIEDDACNVTKVGSEKFDIVFSNSVMEHVGPLENQAKFASEVLRLGRSYWIQTPSKYFSIECHCGMPFWWFYPLAIQIFFISRWKVMLPEWCKMIEETRVLEKRTLRALFPDSTILTERFFGFPKSYIVLYSSRTHRREAVG